MRYKFLLITLTFLSSIPLFAEEYLFESYNASEGLMHPYVYSIAQDKDGFLWLATNEGAYRFDGIDFDYYTQEQGLLDDFISKVYSDSKGRIWLGHPGGSVSLLHGGIVEGFIEGEDNQGQVVIFMKMRMAGSG